MLALLVLCIMKPVEMPICSTERNVRMIDLKNIEDMDEETKNMIEAHAALIAAPSDSNEDWSLEQRSPYRYVPSIVTDCAYEQDEA